MPVAGNSELRKDVIELTPCGLVKKSVISFLTDDNCFHYIIMMCGVFLFFLFPSKFEMGENVVKTVKCGMLKLGFVVN